MGLSDMMEKVVALIETAMVAIVELSSISAINKVQKTNLLCTPFFTFVAALFYSISKFSCC